jgi:hypothetical protein
MEVLDECTLLCMEFAWMVDGWRLCFRFLSKFWPYVCFLSDKSGWAVLFA